MLVNEHIRYEPDERAPPSLTMIAALQGVVVVVSNTITTTTVFAVAFNDDGSYRAWAVFAALIIAGLSSALQAVTLRGLAPGFVQLMGPSSAFLAVCVLAVNEGGLALMSTLVVAASLVQFAVAASLARLRRLITPIVMGVAFMVIPVTVIPIAIDRLDDVPAGADPGAGVVAGVATLAALVLIMLRGSGLARLWAMPIAIVAGCAAAAVLGVYDPAAALEAPWIALPDFSGWPGLSLTLDEDFWALLLVFFVVSAVVAVKTSNEGAVIQQVSRRRPRSIDFRLVQGTMNAGGVSIFLSGIAGTPPTMFYLPSTIALLGFTGVAARRVGITIGVMLVGLALLPKFVAVLLTIPRPVTGAVLMMVMGMLFIEGMRTVFRDGLNQQRAFIVGISLSIAFGLQGQNVLAAVIDGPWGVALGNSAVAGVAAAVAMTVVLEATTARRRRLETELDISAFPGVEAFLRELGAAMGWGKDSTDRLCAAGEETVSAMLDLRDDYETDRPPRLVLMARPGDATVEIEFLAVFSEENIEDRIAYISDQAETPEVGEISFRLLGHYASSVRHRKYYGIDIVAVEVEGGRG